VKVYDLSTTAIKDKSMLSHHAQKLCENIDAYWMTPSCTAAADSNERKFSQRLFVFVLFHYGRPSAS